MLAGLIPEPALGLADEMRPQELVPIESRASRNSSAETARQDGMVADAGKTAPFDTTLGLHGIRFRITSANRGSLNTLHIVPTGLELDNSPVARTIDGAVTGAEVADLDADGSPEVYVYVTSAGSGSYGSLVAYSANRRKSLSDIYLPPITQHKTVSRGYMGHDEFAVGDAVLVRRFPIYRETDINAGPTGGTRRIEYKLVAGEAGWILVVDRVVDY